MAAYGEGNNSDRAYHNPPELTPIYSTGQDTKTIGRELGWEVECFAGGFRGESLDQAGGLWKNKTLRNKREKRV